jgi:hypothetical protein
LVYTISINQSLGFLISTEAFKSKWTYLVYLLCLKYKIVVLFGGLVGEVFPVFKSLRMASSGNGIVLPGLSGIIFPADGTNFF